MDPDGRQAISVYSSTGDVTLIGGNNQLYFLPMLAPAAVLAEGYALANSAYMASMNWIYSNPIKAFIATEAAELWAWNKLDSTTNNQYTINQDKQDKHIEGTKNYDSTKNKSNTNFYNKSVEDYINDPKNQPESVHNNGQKKIYNFPFEIGTYSSKDGNITQSTTRATIHIANDNTFHVVPTSPQTIQKIQNSTPSVSRIITKGINFLSNLKSKK